MTTVMLETQTQDPHIRRSNIISHLALLRQACDWLKVTDGRAGSYPRLLMELSRNNMSPEHTLSVNESFEITELYELWHQHADEFPELENKIREIFRSGPILTEYEKPNNSGNRSRNDAFTILMAGRMLTAGIKVLAVEGISLRGITCHLDADISCIVDDQIVDLQCKRPRSEAALVSRIDEAWKQLRRSSVKGFFGCIAVDCSAFIRRPNTVIETNSLASSATLVGGELVRLARVAHLGGHFVDGMLIGVLFTANVPTMTRAGTSLILGTNQKPFTYFNIDSVRMIVAVLNDTSHGKHLFESIGVKLDKQACSRNIKTPQLVGERV